jgi:hypothetical protein
MKLSSTRDLYGYWNERRGERAAPERADIDPTAIPRLLADTFLLGADGCGEPVFRLAGTRVCALFCRELKGATFADLFGRDSRRQIQELLGIVSEEAAATVAGVTAHLDDGLSGELELLLLPLCHQGRTDSRILGVLASVGSPYWLGAIPVATLSLRALRHIGPVGEARPVAPPPGFRPGRMRHGFVVYDGGRR